MTPRICAIVPSYNHHRTIGEVVAHLRGFGLPVFVIDDGSGPATAAALAALHDPPRGIEVARLPVNRGKGAAVCGAPIGRASPMPCKSMPMASTT